MNISTDYLDSKRIGWVEGKRVVLSGCMNRACHAPGACPDA
jgi:hypothetical protein